MSSLRSLTNNPLVITQTDGSTFTLHTTSPSPIFRTTKDTRNHALWNPSLSSLRNQEQDEAGRLRAFREKFGRGWDLDAGESEAGEDGGEGGNNKVEGTPQQEDSLMDLISGAAGIESAPRESKGGKGEQVGEEKGPGKRVDKGWGSR